MGIRFDPNFKQRDKNIYKVINLLHYYLTNLIRDNIVRRKINNIGESKWI